MSLHDRIMLIEKKSDTTFKDTPGMDAFQHSDGSKEGRRNQTGKGKFVRGKQRRYPVPDKSRASAMGSLSQAIQRSAKPQKVAKAIMKKFPGTCPYIVPSCPPKRNHGAGGPDEHKTSHKGSAKTAKGRWPFVVGKKPDWDKEWKGLGQHKAAQAKGKGSKREDLDLGRRGLRTIEAA
jgi:hypothetical protein